MSWPQVPGAPQTLPLAASGPPVLPEQQTWAGAGQVIAPQTTSPMLGAAGPPSEPLSLGPPSMLVLPPAPLDPPLPLPPPVLPPLPPPPPVLPPLPPPPPVLPPLPPVPAVAPVPD